MDGHGYTQSFDIRMDPRVTTSAAGLEAQFALARKIAAAMNSSDDALRAAQALNAKLAALKGNARAAAVAPSIESLERKLTAIAGGGPGMSSYFGLSGGPSLSGVNVELGMLLIGGEQNGGVEGADVAPTVVQQQAFDELNGELDRLLATWKEIQATEVPALNRQLRQAGVPEVTGK